MLMARSELTVANAVLLVNFNSDQHTCTCSTLVG